MYVHVVKGDDGIRFYLNNPASIYRIHYFLQPMVIVMIFATITIILVMILCMYVFLNNNKAI